MKSTRATVDLGHMSQELRIRGLRIPIATVVGMMADRMPEDEIVQAYPDLDIEDI